MARKPRDYRAEEARRNELAKQRGFATRAAERGAKTRKDFKRAGYRSHAQYVKERAKAREWSERISKQPATVFNLRSKPEEVREYNEAFTKHERRIRHTADWLHKHYPERYPSYDEDREFWENY